MKLRIYRNPVTGWAGLIADHSWIAISYDEQLWNVIEIKDWFPKDNHVCSHFTPSPMFAFNDMCPGYLIYEVELDDVYFEEILKYVSTYKDKNNYVRYPGPNSNTFIQRILKHIELDYRLPFRCLGARYE